MGNMHEKWGSNPATDAVRRQGEENVMVGHVDENVSIWNWPKGTEVIEDNYAVCVDSERGLA